MGWKKFSFYCGVPQGSMLGPLLLSIYMLPLHRIIQKTDSNYFKAFNGLNYMKDSLTSMCLGTN